MSITAPVFDKSDPKSDKVYAFHLPFGPEWEEQKDIFGSTAMLGAGAGMFIRNPLFVWGSMILSVAAFVNQQPLRQKADAQSPIQSLLLSLAGVFAVSMPKMLIGPNTQTAVPTP